MVRFSHRNPLPHELRLPFAPELRILLPMLLLAALCGSMTARPSSAEQDLACSLLKNEKWLWQLPSVDLIQSLEETSRWSEATSSVRSCWECGIWMADFLDASGSPLANQEAHSFQRARCYEALGMKEEALGAYRRHIEAYPQGDSLRASQNSILDILFHQRNLEAVVSFAQTLQTSDPGDLLPESSYLIGQSHYILGQDGPAQERLDSVPQDSEVYPYALLARAQVEYRKGNAAGALSLIDSLLEAPSRPSMSRATEELFRLTRSRILYQLRRFQDAADGFRTVGQQGSTFVPDSLMGMGWTYEALGNPAKAIAHFLAVEETPADPDTLSRAQMEAARIFSQARDYTDASELFHQVQLHLLHRSSQYKKWAEEPEWLNLLARALVVPASSEDPKPLQGVFSEGQADLWQEVLGLLARERSHPGPLRSLVEIQEALEGIESSVRELAGRKLEPAGFVPSPMSSYFPPLDPPGPTLDAAASKLLDVFFRLLDTENRLIYSAGLLGLSSPEERRDFHLAAFHFHRPLLEDILFPRDAGESIHAVLNRMQSRVRHLPYSLQERETVLEKLLYTKRILQETGEALSGWTERIERTSSSPEGQTRLLLLRQWMAYARSLRELRSWRFRSPLLFLAEEPRSPDPLPALDLAVDVFEAQAGERIREVRGLLVLLLEREIQRIHRQRADELRDLLATSQRLFAEALLLRQQEITKSLQAQEPDEGTP